MVTSAPVVSKTGIIYAFVLKVIRVFLDTHIEWSPGLTKINFVTILTGDLIDSRSLLGVIITRGVVFDEPGSDGIIGFVNYTVVIGFEESRDMTVGKLPIR